MTDCATDNNSCITKKACNWKGKILGFIAFFLITNLVGYVVWHKLFFNVWTSDAYVHLTRPMSDPMWQYMPVAYAIYAYTFIVLFHKFSFSICPPCGTNFGRGALFGLYLWLVIGLMPAAFMLIVYPVGFDYIQIHLIDSFTGLILGGGLVGLVFRKPYCDKASKTETK